MGERETVWNSWPRSGDSLGVHVFLALACSGPGAAALIGRAELTVVGGFAFALVLWLVGGVRRRRGHRGWGAVALGVVPPALHPLFFVNARMGDCGRTATAATIAMAVISLTWAAWPMKSPAPRVG